MAWPTIEVIQRLAAMGGCLCSKEVVNIDGTNYRVKERIAEGGFSTIDLVENGRTGRKFALKRITCHSIEDQIQANKEIEYHKRLDHQNILKLVGSAIVGKADISRNATSEVRLLMPLYQKGTLHDELIRREARKDPFQELTLLNLFLTICEAVHYLHHAQPEPIAHRDLKPHNVLLEDDFTPVLMDLGSMTEARFRVKNHSEAQYLQDVAAERCSMPYRAPELFIVNSGCNIDERTDIWSLGCLLYAMCFYHSPYDEVYSRGDSVALAVQSGAKNIRFPGNSAYSTGLKDLILLMLNPEFRDRPFIEEIISRVQVLIEANEERL